MFNKENKNLFYIIGVVVAAASVIAGAVITILHFTKKKKGNEVVYEFDCTETDCENCEMCDECGEYVEE